MRTFREYLRYADRYLSKAEDASKNQEDVEWLLIPAIILAWSAVEYFVNNRLGDWDSLPSDMFELHEKAFLLERRLRFVDSGSNIGKFVLEGSEYQSIENKIFFLLSKSGDKRIKNLKQNPLWQRFKRFKNVRDGLVHPKRYRQIDIKPKDVRDYIETAKELIQTISERVWKKRLDI
jgi:hypothetical protein